MTKQELEQCIKEYGKDIYSFCRHLTCNLQEADDLYQDTFLKLIELREKVSIEKQPKSYLLSITVRLWKNRRRKYAWRNRIAPMETFSSVSEEVVRTEQEGLLEDAFITKEEAMLVRKQVGKLPERLRLCVLLFYMEELSVAEIARILKVPEGTVKSRLYQARKQLEKELENVL